MQPHQLSSSIPIKKSCLPLELALSHGLLELKSLAAYWIVGTGVVWIGVARMEERDNLEAALVDVEVEIPLFEVWGVRLPRNGPRIARFNLTT